MEIVLKHLRASGQEDILGFGSRSNIVANFVLIFVTRSPHQKMGFVAKLYITHCYNLVWNQNMTFFNYPQNLSLI